MSAGVEQQPKAIDVWNKWLSGTKTTIAWQYNPEKGNISTVIWQPVQKKNIGITIWLGSEFGGGTLVEYRGNKILCVKPIHVTNDYKIMPAIEDLLWIGEVEHMIYGLMPYPIYEELYQYRMHFGSARSIADVIEEHIRR